MGRRLCALGALVAALALALYVPRAGSPLPECPPELDCRFVPAAYAQTDPADPDTYGNYDVADRPADGNDIRYIVVHNTEVNYDRAIELFRNPRKGAAAHYLVRSSDGQVTQFIPTKDVAFHAGNYWFNTHSIGVEHEGLLAEGDRWYTDAMYRASARLVRYLAARYHIPLDREHILGHDELPGLTGKRTAGMHYDPGPYWDWARYFQLLGAPLPATPATRGTPSVLTIAPSFPANSPPLSACAGNNCADQPDQGSNAVPLRAAPADDAPLVGDTLLHPDGAPGTDKLSDWSARAVAGQSFAVARRHGEWTGIWFGGRLTWLRDPRSQVSVMGDPSGPLLTPRPGRATIPVYGAAAPEAGAYPEGVPAGAITPLGYTIPAGQVYLGVRRVRSSDYHARFAADQNPDGNRRVAGDRELWQISFNHRRVFVDAADVTVASPGSGPRGWAPPGWAPAGWAPPAIRLAGPPPARPDV
ncbi:N-acetyl-anhydromuramyl-L-alanine amidase AmpD [Pseudonocardia eucalypti]|uniref:N-acetylmuramoyl-L-alanine amidase n=1 Tax=Pseudonocardia eucalypti TaxID=648755 RepID=UPI00181D19E8|nr:N-acetyl-anhydromuramyl-L-alanine amidase AmpD [Pseudonocardia eucalypti]